MTLDVTGWGKPWSRARGEAIDSGACFGWRKTPMDNVAALFDLAELLAAFQTGRVARTRSRP